MGSMIRNIDLMNQLTERRSTVQAVMPRSAIRFSQNIFEDVPLLGATPIRLRQSPIARCSSISIQMSLVVGGPVTNPTGIATVTVRDQGLLTFTAGTNRFNGYELQPGDSISFESDIHELLDQTFLDPTNLFVVLNEAAAATMFATLHVIYGVMQ